MTDFLATIADALGNAFQMAWEVWWSRTRPSTGSTTRGQAVCVCSAGCREAFERDPERYAAQLRGTAGWRPLGLLRGRA